MQGLAVPRTRTVVVTARMRPIYPIIRFQCVFHRPAVTSVQGNIARGAIRSIAECVYQGIGTPG